MDCRRSPLIILCTAALMVGVWFAPQTARAGLLLEPYVGYDTGEWNKGSNCTTCSAHQSGATFGARVGVESMGFMLGADAMSGSWTDQYSPSDDETPSSVGAFVGYDGQLMRFYVGYGISSTLKQTRIGYDDTFSGTDYKIGIGFHLVPLIALNFEYIDATYTKDSSGPLASNATSKMYGACLSIPVNL